MNFQVGGTDLSILYKEKMDVLVDICHGVECFLLLLHLVIPSLCLYLSYSKKLVHINFSLVVNFTVAASYPMSIARFLFILRERGHFENNVSLMVVCSVIRGWYLFGLLFTQPAALIERFICSIYIETYERTKNLHIAFCLIFMVNVTSLLLSILMLFDLISFLETLILLGIIQVALCPMVIKILKINKEARHRYTSSRNRYSLSLRFQVSENFRIMRLTVNLLIVTIFLFLLAGVVIFLRISAKTPISIGITGMVYQIFMTTAPLFFFATTLFSFREYRSHLLSILGCKGYTAKVSVVDAVDTKKYFEILTNSWK